MMLQHSQRQMIRQHPYQRQDNGRHTRGKTTSDPKRRLNHSRDKYQQAMNQCSPTTHPYSTPQTAFASTGVLRNDCVDGKWVTPVEQNATRQQAILSEEVSNHRKSKKMKLKHSSIMQDAEFLPQFMETAKLFFVNIEQLIREGVEEMTWGISEELDRFVSIS